jgi:PEP-CTERM motif
MFSRTSRIGVLGLAVSALLGGAGAAQAGLLSANSGGAIAAFTGSQLFDDNFIGFTVSANVDYAVFAPGAFGVAFPGQDPSGGTDYVYAYQISNLDTDISKMTVGLDGDEPLGAVGFVSDVGLVDPSAALYVGAGPSSTAWDFDPGTLTNGTSSAILIFTSAAAPELDSTTVAAGWSNSNDLPSPVPEPATLSLVALGVATGCYGRRRRH